MDPNFDRMRQRFENSPGARGFNTFRRQFRRSANGKLLGVFSGIAESRGYCVRKVRWIGAFALLFLATSVAGTHAISWATLFVCGFFYLLAALLMQAPGTSASQSATPPPMPFPPASGSGGAYAGAAPGGYPPPPVPGSGLRPDFAAIDRQLDGLNRRIQRMETIVTDRQYDWDRRMGS